MFQLHTRHSRKMSRHDIIIIIGFNKIPLQIPSLGI